VAVKIAEPPARADRYVVPTGCSTPSHRRR
jgi:hypothetical protein